MTTIFAQKLAIITEIKNILDAQEISVNDCIRGNPWIIKDSVVHNFDNISNEITKIKVHRNNIKKNEQSLKVQDEIKKNTENLDFIDSFVTDQNIMQSHIQKSIVNAKMDNIISNEDIKQHQSDYNVYVDSANEFLEKFNYFKQWDNNCMKTEDILTKKAYFTYVTKMISRMIRFAEKISAERFDSKSPQYYENCINIPSSTHAAYAQPDDIINIQFIPTRYRFTNIVENQAIINEFAYLVKQLYTMCLNIPYTYYFVNSSLYNYATINYIDNKLDLISNYNNQFLKLRREYNMQEVYDKKKFPTTWTERIQYLFCSIRVADDTKIEIQPFSAYFKYTELWFKNNGLRNEIYKLKHNIIDEMRGGLETNIDFVKMLFDITPDE